MRISVVIPTYNEEKNIEKCLLSIKNQTIKPYEIIVADSNSEDRTVEIAKKYAKVIVIKPKVRTVAIGRQAGADVAKGDIIAFTDADSQPERNWLEKIKKEFEDKRVIAVYGEVLTERPYTILSKFYNLFLKVSRPLFPSPAGMNIAVRKSAFEKEKFNIYLVTCEEIDLFNRLKKHGKIKFVNAVVRTSARRIRKFNIVWFMIYHTINLVRYHILKSPSMAYEKIAD